MLKAKLKFLLLIFALIFAVISSNGYTDEYLFRKISPPEGFTYGNIRTITEDCNGFVWFGTEHGLYRYNSRHVKKFSHDKNDAFSIPGDNIQKLLTDRSGRLWVVSTNGICFFDEQLQGFKTVALKNKKDELENIWFNNILENSSGQLYVLKNNEINQINFTDTTLYRVNINFIDNSDAVSFAMFDNSDVMWIATYNGCIYNSSPPYRYFNLFYHRQTDRIRVLCQDNASIWIGYEFSGLDHVNQDGLLIESYSENANFPYKLPNDRIRAIVKDSASRIWIGTYSGMALITRNSIQIIKKDFYNSLPHNSIHSLYVDAKDGLWIGTWSGGLAHLDDNDNRFLHFNPNQSKNSLNSNIVSSFCEDRNGHMWVATEDGGLNKFNRKQKEFLSIEFSDPSYVPANIKCISADEKNQLWVGTFGTGVWLFDLKTESFKRSLILDGQIKNVYSIDVQKNDMWLGTYGSGLYYYNLETGNFKKYITDNTDPTSLTSNLVRILLTDSYGGLWVGTQNGLNYKPKGSDSFKRYFSNTNFGLSISNDQIFALNEDSKGQIWIGTGGGGVNCYNPENGKIKVFAQAEGLSGNIVVGILEDNNGNMWFSTENGLSKYSPDKKEFKNYSIEDGLQGMQFNPGATFKCSNGELLFGGPNGFNLFHPDNLAENPVTPKVFLTNLEINNEKREPGVPNIQFLNAIYTNSELKLNYEQNSLNFEFVSNNFIQPAKNRFRYRMLNYENNWIDGGTEGKAVFTKIPPGNYTFEVLGSNNDGIWSSESAKLEINIGYPIWKSNLAYLVYFMIILTAAWFLRKEILTRNKLKNQLLIEKVQRENEEKLHQMKLRFFTNISHEFRTPLTLILSPLEMILNKKYHDNESREHLTMIQRNAQRLRMLINEIIDLRKFELGKMVFSPAKTDLISLCTGICNHYEVFARDKNISFSLVSSYQKYELEVDSDKLDKVIFNLLSNAFKFTPEGGKITLRVEEAELHANNEPGIFSTNPELAGKVIAIRIIDTGPEIPDEEVPGIFDRFNQSKGNNKQGAGIGLNLSREYARVHNGAISVEHSPENGMIFSILIPLKANIKNEKVQKEFLKSWIETKDLNPVVLEDYNESSSKPNEPSNSILIIEDNHDMLKQIKCLLKKDYKVITASNGSQGLEMAMEIYPDIIITDVIMPGMNGIQLCKKIKEDIRTSHIPVILLTALSETENQIDGLKTGADAYITKPFDNQILIAQVGNLIKSRERMHQLFRESEEKWAKESNLNQRDKNLVERSTQIVEKHLLDTNFSVDQLAFELGVSRSSLHRKMRILTNQSATEFIRYVRMKKAIKLMKESDLNIDEIGFAVGYNSHSYFSQCFKKLYGKTPTEYMTEIRLKQHAN